ncbi:MAG: S1C family serine protease [Thermomicrobiales bacterium]
MTNPGPTRGLSALAQCSRDLENAVEHAANCTVTVYGRRRLPASGIAWSPDGSIVTANHVVERDEDVTIGLPSGERLAVSVRGRDIRSDLAFLAPESPDAVKSLTAERSDLIPRPGTMVVALGRPGNGGIMASFGAVSATGIGFAYTQDKEVANALRADVAMLPGFSGGPLIDTEGRILGMNSSHLLGGLTLTTALIDGVVASLAEYGRVRQGYLGIGAQSVKLPSGGSAGASDATQERGLLIVAVEEGGPAGRAGLLLGDVILRVADTAVSHVETLQALLTGDRVDSQVSITLVRAGHLEETTVTVGDRA